MTPGCDVATSFLKAFQDSPRPATEQNPPLRHPLQGLERGLHVSLGEAHQQPVVLHPDLVNGLSAALLKTPLQLRGQVLKAILSGIHQLQL